MAEHNWKGRCSIGINKMQMWHSEEAKGGSIAATGAKEEARAGRLC